MSVPTDRNTRASRVLSSRPGDPIPRLQTEIGVLDRSVQIIDAVRAGATSMRAISRATGLPIATTHRLFRSLEAHGLLARGGGEGFRLGPRLLELARSALRDIPLIELAHPALERLATGTGESAQLYVRSYDVRVCIDAVQSRNELRAFVNIGAELPIAAGSAGKIFLAHMPAEEADRLIASAKKLTDDTPTGDRLRQQVSTARRRGFATSAGEREAGVGSVSAPILGRDQLIAVVSIAGPATRLSRFGAARYGPAVTDAAREIERALGVSYSSD